MPLCMVLDHASVVTWIFSSGADKSEAYEDDGISEMARRYGNYLND